MPDPGKKLDVTEEKEEKGDLISLKNGLLFSMAAVVVGAAIYFLVKENKRKKQEKELLDYDVWG